MAALRSLGVGWDSCKSAWTFPERDGAGETIGLLRRFRNGSKKVAKGGKRGLYIPAELAEQPGPVLLPEGASDTAAILSCGAAAVGRPSCNGGGDLLVELVEQDSRDLVVVGDNDEEGTGRAGAQETARLVASKLKRPVNVSLPPAEHKDVREWSNDFHEHEGRWPNRDELMDVLGRDSHTIQPGELEAETNKDIVLSNFAISRRDDGPAYREGLPLEDLRTALWEHTGGWPKRVGDTLFVVMDGRPVFLETPAQLLAWVDNQFHVDWHRGSDCISQERFFENLRMTAQAYEAIETLPHFPPLPDTYYLHRELPTGDGQYLEQFVDFFRPATPADREQIKALVATLFWGGPAGSRPASLITGPERDVYQGRGVGKSRLLAALGQLAGGFVEVQPHEDMPAILKRLLSPDARSLRIARLDNVKTLRFSWAELEGLITSPVISGHRMYKGEGRRPNHLVWGITLNGGSLSKDFAQRCRIIRLARPQCDPKWDERLENFVEEHRWQILADIQRMLEQPGQRELAFVGRWPTWQHQVLAKVNDPDKCERLNQSRQEVLDDDAHERDLVVAEFRERLLDKRVEPDRAVVFIPIFVLADWLKLATGEQKALNKVTAYLRTLAIPELRYLKRNGTPGWVWRGCKASTKAKATTFDAIATSPYGVYRSRAADMPSE
jgi:hypothetical protein